jgi:pimeloyl-ACP methyl ester carboxylesterase
LPATVREATTVTTSTLPGAAQQTPGAGFTEHTVEIDGFSVRYAESGAGEALVVLHGAGGLRHSCALDLLAEQYRVLAIEMPGFGQQPNQTHETLAQLAQTVARVVEAIGLERYHLLGTSFGGATAAHLAVAHPDRIISLVLEGPAAFREGATSPAEIPPEDMLRRFRTHPERVPAFLPPDPEFMARTWPLVDRLLGSRPEYDTELADQLPELMVRTLVLFGDRDGIIPPENGRTWRRLMPNCCFILVHDAAHDIQGDRAEAFAEVVDDWLARGWQFLLPEEDTLINP